jgi:uncharacterized membrane protein YhhN
MPKRALYEKRPYLLASIAAAIAFYLLHDAEVPGLYLILLKGLPVALLGFYAWLRHKSRDAHMVTAIMVVAALGDMAIELDQLAAGGLFLVSHLIALALYLSPHNRRRKLTGSQGATAGALLIATPVLAYLLTSSLLVAIYGLVLGAMAGAAWTSRFSRYHVGIGAVLFVVSDLLIFSRDSGMELGGIQDWLIWPLYYTGQFLICTGVIQTLRRDHQA